MDIHSLRTSATSFRLHYPSMTNEELARQLVLQGFSDIRAGSTRDQLGEQPACFYCETNYIVMIRVTSDEVAVFNRPVPKILDMMARLGTIIEEVYYIEEGY